MWLDDVVSFIKERYPDVGEPEFSYASGFALIILPNCGWEEWDRIVKEVKRWMEGRGWGEYSKRVWIVCREGLRRVLVEQDKMLAHGNTWMRK